jgi:peptidoglycan/LPS O-acetylase OafA/YrhL
MTTPAHGTVWQGLVPTGTTSANHFNTIRLAMALLVVWSHSFAIYYGTEDFEPVSLLLDGKYNAGNIGVRVFFAISGFLIVQSWERTSSPRSYFEKRVKRIYPGYLVALAICSFVIVPAYSSQGFSIITPNLIGEWAWKNLLMRNFIPASDAFPGDPLFAINGSLWSIPFEFWCYIAVAALGLTRLIGRGWFPLFALIAIILVKAWLDATGREIGGPFVHKIFGWPYLWFSMAPSFLVGVVTLKFGGHIPRSRWILVGLVMATIATAHLFASRVPFDLLFIPTMGYALFYMAFSPIKVPDAARYGDISYGTYLYAFPCQRVLVTSLPLPFPAYVAASLVLAMIAGALSWSLVERHFVGSKAGSAPQGTLKTIRQ